MRTAIIIDKSLELDKTVEIIERKGLGHPDTLADELGERLSIIYSKYCLEKFGVILHHNFDKVGLMGGMSLSGFGEGKILSPIRVLINGRASLSFGNDVIKVKELFEKEVESFFAEKFPHITNRANLYTILWEVSVGSSPGGVSSEDSYRQHWFQPRGKEDLSELKNLNCNDTSMGVAYYGNTPLERFVLSVESTLNGQEYKKTRPWLGSDIKIMCSRVNTEVDLTLCVPQIGIYVEGLSEYKRNLQEVLFQIKQIASEVIPDYKLEINLNMRDRFDESAKDLYITYTGSSIEMGDEGFVGRGNRFGGMITPNRLYSMEGIAGKNPVYHTGKMYSAFAYELSKGIYEKYNVHSEVLLVGMTGHALRNPHRTIVKVADCDLTEKDVHEMISNLKAEEVTNKILNGYYRFF